MLPNYLHKCVLIYIPTESFILSFNKYLLCIHYMPDSVLGRSCTHMNRTSPNPYIHGRDKAPFSKSPLFFIQPALPGSSWIAIEIECSQLFCWWFKILLYVLNALNIIGIINICPTLSLLLTSVPSPIFSTLLSLLSFASETSETPSTGCLLRGYCFQLTADCPSLSLLCY